MLTLSSATSATASGSSAAAGPRSAAAAGSELLPEHSSSLALYAASQASDRSASWLSKGAGRTTGSGGMPSSLRYRNSAELPSGHLARQQHVCALVQILWKLQAKRIELTQGARSMACPTLTVRRVAGSHQRVWEP